MFLLWAGFVKVRDYLVLVTAIQLQYTNIFGCGLLNTVLRTCMKNQSLLMEGGFRLTRGPNGIWVYP